MGKNRNKHRNNPSGGDLADGVQNMSVDDTSSGGTSQPGSAGRGRGRGRGSRSGGDFPPVGAPVDGNDEFPTLGAAPQGRAGGAQNDDFPALGAPSGRSSAGRGRGSAPQQRAQPPQQQMRPQQPVAPLEQLKQQQQAASQRSEHQPQGNVNIVTRTDLAVQHFESQVLKPPKRPGYGTRGRRTIDLRTNHFAIDINYDQVVQHYDVQIQELDPPPRPKGPTEFRMPKGLARNILMLVERENAKIFRDIPVVYDGVANVFTHMPLPLNLNNGCTQTFDVCRVHSEKDRKERFEVTLNWVAAIELKSIVRYMKGEIGEIPQNAINAVDAIFRQSPTMKPSITAVGRSFYVKPDDPNKAWLGGGREIWFGYFQSARISNWQHLTLNIDVTATTFYPEQNMSRFCVDFLGLRDNESRPLREQQIYKLRRELSGLKASYSYAGKKMRKVTSVSLRPANTQTFTLDQKSNNRQMTVAKYFLDKHKITLRFGFLPCIQFGRKDGQTYIPVELCTLVGGQRGQRKMTEMQTSQMIRKTAVAPALRAQEITRAVRDSDFNRDRYAQSFGISVDSNMKAISGRILDAPPMRYDQDRKTNPRQGAWETRNLQFFKRNAPVTNWGMVSFCDRTHGDQLQRFCDQLCSTAKSLGMDFSQPTHCHANIRPIDCKALFQDLASKECKFVVVILGGGGTDLYANVKQVANVELGIMTQCLKSQTLQKANPMLLGNVCQKMNAKLGGVNTLPCDDFLFKGVMAKPTLIIGADVTHPSPGDKFRPSIAALVGSKDRWAVEYTAQVRVQTHRQEMITDMSEMVKELLMKFFKSTKHKPEKIIMFRDGVSEGQFDQVLNIELRAIQAACTSLQADYKPGITQLIVQKRHHTRFFPENPNDGEGKHKNVPAGTLVDRGVTHPTEFDYYLCSHAGIQGTSRPAHYHVLWDDNHLSADDLQSLSFYLCHCYSNCTRSVSIPAPAYYAHKAAFMARHHLECIYDENGSVHSGSSCSSTGDPTDAMKKAVILNPLLQNTMYFL